MPTITIPHNYDVKNYLLPFLSAKQRFKIAVIHRRGRKTRTLLNEQIAKSQVKKGIYYFVLPTYRQAKQVVWDELVKDHVPNEIVDKKNDSELAIYYKNGSIQRFIGSEDPDKHRGVNAIDWVFDEFSEQNPRIWYEIAQPVIRENGGTASFGGTPKGKNHFWKLLQFAKENQEEWFTCVLPASQTGVFSEQELAEARKAMPESVFEQEFMCAFNEGAGAFFRRVNENTYNYDGNYSRNHEIVLGVDLGKYQDFTVITPFDLTDFKVLPQERFNQIDWNLQKARIEAAYLRYNATIVRMDGTGLGDPLVDDLMSRSIPIESFKFGEQSRKDLLTNLALMLEQDKIKIPRDEGLIEELQAFQSTLNDAGKIKVESLLEHDDRVFSLALAVWKAPQEPLGRQALLYGSQWDKQSSSNFGDEFAGFDPI